MHRLCSFSLSLFVILAASGPCGLHAAIAAEPDFSGPTPVEAVVEYALQQTPNDSEKPRVRKQVKLLYFEIWRLERSIESRRKQEPFLQNMVQILQAQHETGNVGLGDVLEAQLKVSELEVTILGLGQDRDAAKSRLAALLKLPRDKVPGTTRHLTPEDVPALAEVLVAIMDRCRPELPNRRHVQGEVEALHAELHKHEVTLRLLEKDILPKSEQVLKLMMARLRLGKVSYARLAESSRIMFRYRLQFFTHQAAREKTIAALELEVGCPVSSWKTDGEASADPKPPVPDSPPNSIKGVRLPK